MSEQLLVSEIADRIEMEAYEKESMEEAAYIDRNCGGGVFASAYHIQRSQAAKAKWGKAYDDFISERIGWK